MFGPFKMTADRVIILFFGQVTLLSKCLQIHVEVKKQGHLTNALVGGGVRGDQAVDELLC